MAFKQVKSKNLGGNRSYRFVPPRMLAKILEMDVDVPMPTAEDDDVETQKGIKVEVLTGPNKGVEVLLACVDQEKIKEAQDKGETYSFSEELQDKDAEVGMVLSLSRLRIRRDPDNPDAPAVGLTRFGQVMKPTIGKKDDVVLTDKKVAVGVITVGYPDVDASNQQETVYKFFNSGVHFDPAKMAVLKNDGAADIEETLKNVVTEAIAEGRDQVIVGVTSVTPEQMQKHGRRDLLELPEDDPNSPASAYASITLSADADPEEIAQELMGRRCVFPCHEESYRFPNNQEGREEADANIGADLAGMVAYIQENGGQIVAFGANRMVHSSRKYSDDGELIPGAFNPEVLLYETKSPGPDGKHRGVFYNSVADRAGLLANSGSGFVNHVGPADLVWYTENVLGIKHDQEQTQEQEASSDAAPAEEIADDDIPDPDFDDDSLPSANLFADDDDDDDEAAGMVVPA